MNFPEYPEYTFQNVLSELTRMSCVNLPEYPEYTYQNVLSELTRISLVYCILYKYCIGVFFDLKKAFDVCLHSILLKKIRKLGVSGTSLDWFKSYSSDQKQCVDMNGKISSTKDIQISVLQGSILGPILFLCYINDLPGSKLLYTLLFADDTACLASGPNLLELINYVNTELNKIAIWFQANKIAINADKTKYIIFHAKNKTMNPGNSILVFDNNEASKPY